MQMAGWMGTGKSTLAVAIAERTGAIVLDHDTTKSAILSAGVPHHPAGGASYEVLFAITEDLLSQGRSVIIDSPSLYASIPTRGRGIADTHGVAYHFTECDCPSEQANRRIAERTARPSQVTSAADAEAVRADPARSMHRPTTGAILVDTSGDLAACVEQVLRSLG